MDVPSAMPLPDPAESATAPASPTTPACAPKPPRSARRRTWRLAVITSLLAACPVFSPALLVHTSARNNLLAIAIHSNTLVAKADAADGGWFQPLVFHNLLLLDADGKVSCRIGRLETSKGLLAFLTDSNSPLHLTIQDAFLRVDLETDGSWPECGRQGRARSLTTWSIHNGAFQLNAPWRPLPIVDVDQLHLNGRIGPDSNGLRQLSIRPFTVLDHAHLSDNHASQNLALIAPILSRTTRINGNASVQLDAITVPLDGTYANSPLPLSGRAEFHALDASLREEIPEPLAQLIRVAGLPVPRRIALLQEMPVHFEVTADGIRHDGMAVLLPDLAENLQVSSSGTIGLDESLDLQLTFQLPQLQTPATTGEPTTHLSKLLTELSQAPLSLHVSGTVSAPAISLPDSLNLASQLIRRLAPEVPNSATPSLPSAVSGLIHSISQNNNPDNSTDSKADNNKESARQLSGSIINLIRAVDQSTKKSRKKQQGQNEKNSPGNTPPTSTNPPDR